MAQPVEESKVKRRETEEEKQQRLALERDHLMAQVEVAKPDILTTTKAKVAYILNHFPETRDSDVKLYFEYWRTFQFNIVGGADVVSERDLLKLERPTVLTRVRAKIQNEYKIYQAKPEVQELRTGRRQEVEEENINDKPGDPCIYVYCDESGKSQEFALVGSLWMYDGFEAGAFIRDVVVWKSQMGITGEFHFAELTRANLEHAKAFFQAAVSRSDLIGFKAVAVRQKGLGRKQDDVVSWLYYELVHSGLEHELKRGRVTIPRSVHLKKDREDGADPFLIREIEQRLTTHFMATYDADVSLDKVEALESTADPFIQLADLFTGSINRMLNGGGSRNQKDEFAEFALELLGLEVSRDKVVAIGDQDVATVIMLNA